MVVSETQGGCCRVPVPLGFITFTQEFPAPCRRKGVTRDQKRIYSSASQSPLLVFLATVDNLTSLPTSHTLVLNITQYAQGVSIVAWHLLQKKNKKTQSLCYRLEARGRRKGTGRRKGEVAVCASKFRIHSNVKMLSTYSILTLLFVSLLSSTSSLSWSSSPLKTSAGQHSASQIPYSTLCKTKSSKLSTKATKTTTSLQAIGDSSLLSESTSSFLVAMGDYAAEIEKNVVGEEVYGPIFKAGLFLFLSGLISAFVSAFIISKVRRSRHPAATNDLLVFVFFLDTVY